MRINSLLKIVLIGITGAMAGETQGQNSMNVSLLYHWENPSLPASFAHGNIYNEVWGYAAGGREYAIIGSTNGTHIFDVTEPSQAEEIHFVPGAVQGGQIVHRDYKNYGQYLYAVCDEGLSSLQVIDLSGLPDALEIVYDSSALFSRAHNIYIDEAYARMYVCGGNNQFDVYGLDNPESPQLLLRCATQVPGWSTNVGYVHDAFVRDNIAWCNAEDGLWAVDFSDIENPVFLGDLSVYPESGYNHSGWMNEDNSVYALADETHGTRIKLCDVSDPTDINVLSMVGSGVNNLSIVHNIIVRDNIMHVSYYHDGYYAWDISDASNPVVLGFYDTSTEAHAQNYKGAWGVYPLLPSGIVLVSDMQEGLFVFGLNPQSVGEQGITSGKIWPNPCTPGSEVTGMLKVAPGSSEWELLQSDGRLMDSGELEIDLQGRFRWTSKADMQAGSYLLRIFAGESVQSVRILLQP